MYYFSSRQGRKINVLRELESLGYDDLRKIKNSYLRYLAKIDGLEVATSRARSENEKIQAKNDVISNAADAWRAINVDPLISERQRLEADLSKLRLGFFGKAFGAVINHEGASYDARYAPAIITRLERVRRDLNSAYSREPQYEYVARAKTPKGPRDQASITIAGQKFRVDYSSLDVKRLDALIEKHQQKIDDVKARENNLRARAAENEKERRRQAQPMRRGLAAQLLLLPVCPYCSNLLSKDNAHLDHIYPVSKGGNSAGKNLVFVCSDCNLAKKDMTLRSFVKSKNYDFQGIESRLESLGKDF